MSEIKKHFFKIPPNIKEMTEAERKAFAHQLWLHLVEVIKKDKEEKEN